MTDGKGLFHATQPAEAPVTDTRVTPQERMAADGVPLSNPHGEGPPVTRSRFGIVRIGGLLVAGAVASWLYIGAVTNNLGMVPPAVHTARNTDQINQAQRRDEGARLVREPSAEAAQLMQVLQQGHDQSEKQVRDLATELAQLKQALQQERDEVGQQIRDLAAKQAETKQAQQQERGKSEQPDSRLTADVAQIRQALQQERDEVGQQIRDLAAKLAETKQAQQQGRGKSEQPDSRLTADVAQIRQALQQERDEVGQQIRDLAAKQAEFKQAQQDERGKSEQSDSRLTADMAQLEQQLQQVRDQGQQQARDLAAALAQLNNVVQQERGKGEQLANRLAADLTQLKQVLQQTETRSALYEKLLEQEHDRNAGLEKQLAELRDAEMSGRGRKATSEESDPSAPTQALVAKQPVNAALAGDKVAIAVVDKPATMAARPAATEAPGNLETIHLMERANVLVAQGDVGAARNVLERAAETGNPSALFALAETHDPVVLAAWGTRGTQGDVAKAKELYARALMGGIAEAKHRLDLLP